MRAGPDVQVDERLVHRVALFTRLLVAPRALLPVLVDLVEHSARHEPARVVLDKEQHEHTVDLRA